MSYSGMWQSLNRGELLDTFKTYKMLKEPLFKNVIKTIGSYFQNNGLQILGRICVKNVFTIPYSLLKIYV